MVVALTVLLFAAPVQAQTTIGQLAPGLNPTPYCDSGPFDGSQIGSAQSVYTAPVSGIVTSWSTNAAAGIGQQLTFKIYRPLGGPLRGESFLVVAHDGPRTLTPSRINTFSVAFPIQVGDVISTDDVNATIEVPSACEFETGNPADLVSYTEGDAPDGSTILTEGTEEEVRMNVTATILPPPVIASLTPAAGSIKGGTSIIIVGSNFGSVKGVSFGGVPATSFSVDSEVQITAVSPPSSSLGRVAVTVANAAGTGTSAELFSYQGCKVPKLTGKKLKAAKRQLRKMDCRLGRVKKRKGATVKTGKVAKQKPKSGKLLTPGSKVNVTLKP
jgi:hypothetical protein